MRELQGHLNASGLRFAIVVSRFNELISKNLLAGALDALSRHGASSENIIVAWTPGAFEIPLIAQKFALSGQFDAIICLGAVIRGATAHFDYVAGQAAAGIAKISLDSRLPVLFGVLTTETIDQAFERSGTKSGNKGFETAVAAIELANLAAKIDQL